MRQAESKADVLIEALPYIRQFRHRVVVVKLGGAFMESEEGVLGVLEDLVFIHSVGIHPVIVHGGGPHITQKMADEGIEPTWVAGRRYTDDAVLGIVEDVLINGVNRQLVRGLMSMGVPALPIHINGVNCLTAEKRLHHEEDGREVDLGHVGRVTGIDAETLWVVIKGGAIPVIAPLARGADGQHYNVNADDVACEVAARLQSAKLVMMTDTHGIRRDPEDPDSIVPTATEPEIERMISSGRIHGGMLPKVSSCLMALDRGVAKAHILDGRIRHALLMEIYTDRGIGTQIVKQ